MAGGLEVADVFRRHGPAFRATRSEHLDRDQRRVMGAIEACRTAALGGHVRRCADCGHTAIAYNSCRNRHCPKCQGRRGRPGSRRGGRSCCPFPISTWSSPCRRRSARSRSRTRRRSTPSCSAPPPRRCASSRPTRATSAPRSAASPCCTPGARRCSTIRTSTASCRAAASRPTARAGSPARPGSSCRSRCSAGCSGGSFSNGSPPPSPTASCASSASSLRSPSPAPSPPTARRCAGSTGWSTPSRPSAAPSRCWPISAATPIASPSPTAGSSPSTDDAVSFLWKDYRQQGRRKVMTLEPAEFMRRFLLHVLPSGFHRIRHFGFLANGHRAARLALCRQLLAQAVAGRQGERDTKRDTAPDHHHRREPPRRHEPEPDVCPAAAASR